MGDDDLFDDACPNCSARRTRRRGHLWLAIKVLAVIFTAQVTILNYLLIREFFL